METGTVCGLVQDRGFGFIHIGGGQEDVFFHHKELAADLPFDDTLMERRVRFDVISTDRGDRAKNVQAGN